MELIGGYLKTIRERKNISLSTVSTNLNISIEFLESIENNDFSKIPGGAYTIGYIRSYSNFLNLNPEEVIQLYKDQVFFVDKEEAINIQKPIESFNFFLTYKLISFFGVISLSLAFYFLFINTNDYFPKFAMIPDISVDMQSEIEEIELENALTKLKNEKKIESEDSFLANIDSLNVDIDVSSANASVDNEILNDLVTIKSLNPTWIQLRNAKDEIVFSSLMNLNDEYTYSITDHYKITAGNAGNLMILINGEVKGKLGKKGEVIEMLIISSDFFN